MEIVIDSSDLAKVGKNFVVRASKLKETIDIILKKSLFVVEKYGKYYSPVKTGRMRASIGGGKFSGGSFGKGEGIHFGEKFASIGPTVEYAKYVHRRIPFMFAAAQSSIHEIDEIVKREIKKAVK